MIITRGYGEYSGTGSAGGTIEIQPDWQLLAIGIEFGWWDATQHKHIHDDTPAKIKNYVMDQIEDLYGIGQVEVLNTYLGGSGQFKSFVPGVTPESSEHNFNLIYDDNGSKEITGFWLKSLNSGIMTISWGKI